MSEDKKVLLLPEDTTLNTTGKDVEKLVLSMLQADNKPAQQTSSLKTFKVERSSLLDKVKTFLPQMEHSNTKLLSSTANLNIEEISEEYKDSFIEMSFACIPEGPEVDAAIHTLEPNSSDSSSDSEQEEESPKEPIIQEL